MGHERIPKKILNGKFNNTRSVGKPRTRWESFVRREEYVDEGLEESGGAFGGSPRP
jgi:hypothetical protein